MADQIQVVALNGVVERIWAELPMKLMHVFRILTEELVQILQDDTQMEETWWWGWQLLMITTNGTDGSNKWNQQMEPTEGQTDGSNW
jgi:hypothetical protein